jgi:hypothetical protein
MDIINNNIILKEFTEIVDTYLNNYSTYKKEKQTFDCEYGEIIFNKEFSNVITIFGILINPKYRKNGIFTYILQYLINKCNELKFKYLCIQSIISKPLYLYLSRYKYKNKNFTLNTEDGSFYFKC